MATGLTALEDRALEHLLRHCVAIVGGCWQWRGATTWGYGTAWAEGRTRRAHRLAYELLIGPIPDGLDLDHLCRNRACVNPTHLEPVTRRVNLLRGVGLTARRAAQTACIHGHPFDQANTIRRRDGTRDCRSCLHNRNRARSRATAAAL